MSRIKKIVFGGGTALLLLGVFVYDVTRGTVELEVSGATYIRELAIFAAFFLVYSLMSRRKFVRSVAIPKNLGLLLAYAVIVVFFCGLFFFVGAQPAREGEIVPVSQIAIFSLLSILLGLFLGMFAIKTLLTIGDLLFHKRKKGTKRNFVIYLVVLALAVLVELPMIRTEAAALSAFLVPVAVVMIIVNSFKQNWIVYLSRREKLYAIAYGALLFLAYLGLNIIVRQSGVERAFAQFHHPLQTFVQLNAMFGAVYFGMAFVSTLFHLPTAEVYERKQSELNSLHNLSRLVTQVFDFQDLVNTVTTMTLEVVGANSAWMELVKGRKEDGEIVVEVVSLKNISREQIETITGESEISLRSIVMESKRALLIDDVAADRRTRHIRQIGVSIGTLLSVPLVSHGELIGFLYATKDFEYGFDQDDIDVLTTFADHVTIAIENSRLIAESLERERFRQEVLVAQEMQKRLLPQRLPGHRIIDIAAMSEPSLEVGGDYYDFVVLDGDRIGVVVGDVSGKGVSAAFYMAEVKGIFQSLSKLCVSPRDLLLRANEALIDSLERRAFISLLYAIIDIPRAQLTLARAGHCPMVFIRGPQAELIRPTGLGLGLTHDRIFADSTQETTIRLRQGDICIFYTDGVNESRNPQGEEFGFDRLVQSALNARLETAERIKEAILADIRNHTGDTTYGDDMTLVVIKWRGDGEAQARQT